MLSFKTILIAADFSGSSRGAFRVACALARQRKARLLVLHVVEPLYAAQEPVYFGDQSVPFTIVEREPSYYDSVKERMCQLYAPCQGIEAEYQTRDGEPVEQILRLTREVSSDLVVMGTHGRSGLDRVLMGSVAERVIREASCPVLALRSRDGGPRLEPEGGMGEPSTDADHSGSAQAPSTEEMVPPPDRPIRHVLHPTDFSEASDAALRVASSLAREQNAHLLILHVIEREDRPIQVPPMPIDRKAHRDALAERFAGVVDDDLTFAVETTLRDGDPATEILRVAEEAGCELIVMGTHGRSGLGRLLFGSVAEAILRRSTCPVLTVKASHHEPRPTAGETSRAEVRV